MTFDEDEDEMSPEEREIKAAYADVARLRAARDTLFAENVLLRESNAELLAAAKFSLARFKEPALVEMIAEFELIALEAAITEAEEAL